MFNYKTVCLVFLTCSLLSGCVGHGSTDEQGAAMTGVSSGAEGSTGTADSEYKYGKPSGLLMTYEAFEPQGEFQDTEPEYQEKTITLIMSLPEGMISSVVTNAVNQYLLDKGYDFSVEFVGADSQLTADTGFAACGDMYKLRKEEGLSADIYMAQISGMTSEDTYKELVREGYALCLDTYLETEAGQQILSGMLDYLGGGHDMDGLNALIDLYRMPDGKLYALPTDMDWSAPYMLCYNNELKEYYGIPDFQGTIEDFSLLEQYADMLAADGVVPLDISGIEDIAFLNLAGYEAYEGVWAIAHDENGKAAAVDFFEDAQLLEWYQRLGELCSKGYVSYVRHMDAIEGMDKELTIPAENMNYSYAYALLEVDASVGLVRVNRVDGESYKTEYDILDVTTYADCSKMLCIDSETAYPEECMEFLALYYSDMNFRALMHYGPEGWGYYVDRSEEMPVVVHHTSNGGLPVGYGIDTGMRDIAVISEAYEDRVQTQYLANSYMKPASIGCGNDIDFSEVWEQYTACMEILQNRCYVLWGVYGENTEEMVEELHQQLLDAGYLDVIACINEQLSQ